MYIITWNFNACLIISYCFGGSFLLQILVCKTDLQSFRRMRCMEDDQLKCFLALGWSCFGTAYISDLRKTNVNAYDIGEALQDFWMSIWIFSRIMSTLMKYTILSPNIKIVIIFSFALDYTLYFFALLMMPN